MTDLSTSRTHERKMLGPDLRLERGSEARHTLDPFDIDGDRRCKPHAHTVQRQRDFSPEPAQRLDRTVWRIEEIVSKYFEHVDVREVQIDSGGEFWPPTDSDTISVWHASPHRNPRRSLHRSLHRSFHPRRSRWS